MHMSTPVTHIYPKHSWLKISVRFQMDSRKRFLRRSLVSRGARWLSFAHARAISPRAPCSPRVCVGRRGRASIRPPGTPFWQQLCDVFLLGRLPHTCNVLLVAGLTVRRTRGSRRFGKSRADGRKSLCTPCASKQGCACARASLFVFDMGCACLSPAKPTSLPQIVYRFYSVLL